MTTSTLTAPRRPFDIRPKLADRLGDPLLRLLAFLAAVVGVGVLIWIVETVFDQASPAISRYGLGFVGSQTWNPPAGPFGAAALIYGTLMTSVLALVVAGPLSVGIALYLTELAPRVVRRPVAILVELLAAIPSVILGLWGILVLGPFLGNHLEPALHSVLGWIPLFSGNVTSYGMFNAILILTIMTVPIATSIMREVFGTTPSDLKEGAYALGATRWEMVKMVILPYGRAGIVGAVILALGRALGEAIAVTQVIGNNAVITAHLFNPAGTLAAQLASEYSGAPTPIQTASLVYLAAILLVISLIVNITARLIVRRVTVRGAA